MRIIPAIDIIEGKCVRLSQGDYNKKTIYTVLIHLKWLSDSKIMVLDFLHLVDLDGAKSSKIINYKILEQIALKNSFKSRFWRWFKIN